MNRTTSARTRAAIGRLATMRGAFKILTLTAIWCALWREISVANVAAGLLLAVAVLGAGAGTQASGRIRLGPMLKLLWIVFVDLVTSTIDVAKEIVTLTDNTDEAIIAVQIPSEGRHHLLLLIIAVTVTPGTAVVDADPDTGTLYLHLLHANRRHEVAEHVHQLTALACDALPISSGLGTPSPGKKQTTA